jgi:hypothetical protein
MGAIQRKSGLHVSAALALAIGLALPLEATAHQDPPGCTGIDNAMRLVVTRNNGDPVVGTVSECETLKFQARLQWVSECLIQGGTFKVVTPDGVDHVVESPVRCLGDATVNAEGCTVGQDTEINSAIIDYTVSPGDAVGNQLTAMAVWENGILHQSPTNVSGQGDDRAIEVTMELCDDELFCNGLETCDPEATNGVQLGLCQPGTPPNCGTSDQCAERGCDEENDECFETDTSGRCGIDDFCVDRGCDPETGCFTIDNSDTQCPDEFCTERTCNPEGGCTVTDVSGKCGVSDECTDRSCDEVNDECDEIDTSGRCGESDFCVDRDCDPETGCTTVDNSDTQCPDEFCTERTCNPETSQCDETDVSGKCNVNPDVPDVCEICDEENDECIVDLTQDPICQPGEIICRTPGFWATHGGTEKSRSQNITQAVIDLGGGCFEVCGEVIDTTVANDANSALEAMCASPRGDGRIQLARQLTAMALNCIVSEVGADCGGDAALDELFEDCNSACVGGASDRSIGECIGDVDCFNNGGCRTDGNCHERELPEEFQPPGPAGSPNECKDARGTACTVIDPGETSCAGIDAGTCGP